MDSSGTEKYKKNSSGCPPNPPTNFRIFRLTIFSQERFALPPTNEFLKKAQQYIIIKLERTFPRLNFSVEVG